MPMRADRAKDSIRELVDSVPSLRAISGPIWDSALKHATVVHEPAGGSLKPREIEADHFTLVVEGAMVLRVGCDDGRMFNSHKVRPGEMCALSVSLLSGGDSRVSEVVADGDLTLIRIPGRFLDPLMSQSAEFRAVTLQSLTGCFGRMMGLIEQMAFDHLPKRIETVLRELSEAQGQRVLRITHQEIANELGSSREVISRLVKQMEREGRLKLGRGAITLLNAFWTRPPGEKSSDSKLAAN
jgi:CRP/FNR family transcriptional regulator